MKQIKKIIPTDSEFTEEFITNHADVIDWLYVSQNIFKALHFSDVFFIRFNNNINWTVIFPFDKLSHEFTCKYKDKIGFIAWYNENNELHRDNDEPAVIFINNRKEWYFNGKLHRGNNKPAIIQSTKKEFWINGKYIKLKK